MLLFFRKPFLASSCYDVQGPLSLSWAPSASVIRAAGGPEVSRRVDPVAKLQAATERNTQKAREEREEAEWQKAAAAKATQKEANAAAKA